MQRIGVGFTGLQPREVVECVQLAEELGYESAWMSEGHGGDQFSVLTACAVATKKILLGTSISSVFVRSAPTIAMAAACVDEFSGGRFILGLGSSHKVQVEGEHGLTYGQPILQLRECVDIVRGLLRDGEVSYKGSIFNIKGFDMWFRPLRKEIPIYLGAVNPKMLQICGEIAQGALLTWSTVEHARAAVENVKLGAREAGRDPQEVDMATSIGCTISANKEEALNSMRRPIATYVAHFPRYRKLMAEAGFVDEVEAVRKAWQEGDQARALDLVPTELIKKITLAGTPEECQQRIAQYRDVGIDLPIITPRVLGPNAKEEVIAAMRACAPT